MILDSLDLFANYVSLNKYFKEVQQFLSTHSLETLPLGITEICGENVYVNVVDSEPRTRTEAKVESHRRMIDIQIPISSAEEHGHILLNACTDEVNYDEENDLIFYPYTSEQLNYLTVLPGQFVIYFPQDGHAPAISDITLRKAIFKVKI